MFGFEVPQHCPEVPDSVLDPASGVAQPRGAHGASTRNWRAGFIENYKKFASPQYAEMYEQIKQAGPRV